MRDTLGVVDENECSVLKQEIDKVRRSCIQDCALFSWGNNKFGQCATAKAKVLSMPKKIEVPPHICLDETNKDLNSIKTQESVYIDRIFCSNKQSGILLSNGELWACGNCAEAGKEIIKGPAAAANPEEESKRQQMQRDEEFSRIVTAQQQAAADEDSEEWGGGRNKNKNKNKK